MGQKEGFVPMSGEEITDAQLHWVVGGYEVQCIPSSAKHRNAFRRQMQHLWGASMPSMKNL